MNPTTAGEGTVRVRAALLVGFVVASAACAGARPILSPADTFGGERRAGSSPRVLFDRVSPYARVLVVEENGRQAMRFGSVDGADQSVIVPGRPEIVPVEYIRYALLGLAHREQRQGEVRRLLMVGLGGGTFTSLVHRAFPQIEIEVIEIDPVVVEAARAHFGLQEDARHRIVLADAARWMAGAPRSEASRFDFVFLDGYEGDDIPSALGSVEYFRAVARHLAPGGVVAINLADIPGQGASAARAFREVFRPFDCRQTPRDGNLVVFGALGERAVDLAATVRWAERWDARGLTTFSLRAVAMRGTSSTAACRGMMGMAATPGSGWPLDAAVGSSPSLRKPASPPWSGPPSARSGSRRPGSAPRPAG